MWIFFFLSFSLCQPWRVAQLVRLWVCSLIVTSSSPLRITYPRQSFAFIVIHVLVGCCVSPGIRQSAHIYETLARIPKVIKKIKSFSLCQGRTKSMLSYYPATLAYSLFNFFIYIFYSTSPLYKIERLSGFQNELGFFTFPLNIVKRQNLMDL